MRRVHGWVLCACFPSLAKVVAFSCSMNPNIAEYHVPVNADVHDIKVIFVDEQDDIVNPMGIKGLGEIGIVGVPAAIANAIYHATGKRVRDLPVTIDKII
mgnify:CR=1 FL=1